MGSEAVQPCNREESENTPAIADPARPFTDVPGGDHLSPEVPPAPPPQRGAQRSARRRSRKLRGRGEGSVYQRKDGTWCASLTIGVDGNGKQRRRSVYGRTKSDVQEGLLRLQRDTLNGDATGPHRLTVAAYLAQWLEGVRPNLRTSSHRSYSTVVRLHIDPVLGHLQLSKLKPMHIQALHTETEKRGEVPGFGSLFMPCCERR